MDTSDKATWTSSSAKPSSLTTGRLFSSVAARKRKHDDTSITTPSGISNYPPPLSYRHLIKPSPSDFYDAYQAAASSHISHLTATFTTRLDDIHARLDQRLAGLSTDGTPLSSPTYVSPADWAALARAGEALSGDFADTRVSDGDGGTVRVGDAVARMKEVCGEMRGRLKGLGEEKARVEAELEVLAAEVRGWESWEEVIGARREFEGEMEGIAVEAERCRRMAVKEVEEVEEEERGRTREFRRKLKAICDEVD